MKKPLITLIIAVFGLVIVVIYQLIVFNDGKLHIVMCNVGQGEAIYIRSPSGIDMLIDGGPDNSVLSCLNRHMPLWDRRIDVLVLTNADLDHYGGFISVVSQYNIGQFVTTNIGKNDEGFEVLEKHVQEQKIPVKIMSLNDVLRDNKVLLKASWPVAQEVNSTAMENQTGRVVLGAKAVPGVNEYSLVLHLIYGEFDMLLTGDVVPPASDEVAKGAGIVEVLKVPHHGSKNGLTEALLDATQPKSALISSGKKNRFGHPHKEVLDLLRKYNVEVYRTDQVEDIEVVSDGKTYRIEN